MTESEWLAHANPWDMIDCVGPGASARKLRLFACACCREVLNPFAPPLVLRVVEAAEAFADAAISADTLAGVRARAARAVGPANRDDRDNGTRYFSDVLGACLSASCQSVNVAEVAQDTSHATASAAGDGPLREGSRVVRREDRPPEFFAELAAQAELFRDIFGNPFREVEVDPAWRTSDVLALASAVYADRDFSAMPILADALQDAGCDDEEVLNHCREAREHVRGCWVVDLLLDKR